MLFTRSKSTFFVNVAFLKILRTIYHIKGRDIADYRRADDRSLKSRVEVVFPNAGREKASPSYTCEYVPEETMWALQLEKADDILLPKRQCVENQESTP